MPGSINNREVERLLRDAFTNIQEAMRLMTAINDMEATEDQERSYNAYHFHVVNEADRALTLVDQTFNK